MVSPILFSPILNLLVFFTIFYDKKEMIILAFSFGGIFFCFRLKIVFEQNLPVAQIHVGILGRPAPSTIFHGG